MKKDKKQVLSEPGRETQPPWLSIAPGITVIAVIMLALFSIVFVLLWRSGMLPSYLGGVFSSSGEKTGFPESTYDEISLNGEADWTFSDEYFYTPDFSDVPGDRDKIMEILRSIETHDNYKQIIAASHGTDALENIIICRDGDKYRIESPGRLVICDGETVYIRTEVNGFIQYEHTWSAASGQFAFESETGLSPLSDIIAEVEALDGIPEFSYDDMDKIITLDGIGNKTAVRSYSISYETGIVLFESAVTPEGEILYRRYTTSYALDPEFPTDTFTIPQTTAG